MNPVKQAWVWGHTAHRTPYSMSDGWSGLSDLSSPGVIGQLGEFVPHWLIWTSLA